MSQLFRVFDVEGTGLIGWFTNFDWDLILTPMMMMTVFVEHLGDLVVQGIRRRRNWSYRLDDGLGYEDDLKNVDN